MENEHNKLYPEDQAKVDEFLRLVITTLSASRSSR